jgi:DNA-binding response OmpR family regulator
VVLAVDDDEGVRESLALDLEEDFDVVPAHDGPSALAVLRLQTVDVVLLDLLLPGVSGLQVLPEIKTIDPALPVIVISAVHQAATIVDAMRLGADNYLTKPWGDVQLLAAVRGALAQRHGAGGAILLVCDDAEGLAPLQVALAREVSVQARTVAAALHAPGHCPALIVLDGRTEPLRVGDAVQALRERYPGAALLVLAPSRTEPRLAPGLGAEVVTGPHRLDDLLHRVGRLLPGRPGPRALGKQVSSRAARAADYIARHYRGPLPLCDVADHVGLSTDRLAHVFRHEVGMPMKEYAMRLRVAVGCRLLAESERKLEDIAQWLGFDHASHFSRVFVDVTGMRPGEYRRRADSSPR